MFDPFLAQMGPLVVVVLFVVLAGLAMAPAAKEVIDSTRHPQSAWRRVLGRLEFGRHQVQGWLRTHSPCAVVAGLLSTSRSGRWR